MGSGAERVAVITCRQILQGFYRFFFFCIQDRPCYCQAAVSSPPATVGSPPTAVELDLTDASSFCSLVLGTARYTGVCVWYSPSPLRQHDPSHGTRWADKDLCLGRAMLLPDLRVSRSQGLGSIVHADIGWK